MGRCKFHLAGMSTLTKCFSLLTSFLAGSKQHSCVLCIMCSLSGDFLQFDSVFWRWGCCSGQFVLHVCMNSEGVGIMKFTSQAKQAQLHGTSMQTFIIEQRAFIIHTSGFLCTQQINFFESVCSSDTLLIDVGTQTCMNIQLWTSTVGIKHVC